MGEPDTRGRTHEVYKDENGHLSPVLSTGESMGENSPSRRRSASLAPSFRSGRSVRTVLEDKSKYFDEPPRPPKRQKTMGVKINLSWLDLVKAFFSGPKKFATKMATRIEPDTEEMDEKGQKRSPFKFIVSVFPRENPVPANHLLAMCTLDTGCLQGNIVSLKFAEKLGYEPKHFEKLSPEEAAAGISALGNIVVPKGAIRLSWYHSESSQVFTSMRFLVLEHTAVDLLIGVHSILQFNLILPPNFECGVSKLDKRKDTEQFKANKKVAACHRRIKELICDNTGKANPKLEADMRVAQAELEIAEKKLQLVKENEALQAQPGKQDLIRAKEDTEKKIAELKKNLKRMKAENKKADQEDKTPSEMKEKTEKKDKAEKKVKSETVTKIEEKGLQIHLKDPTGKDVRL